MKYINVKKLSILSVFLLAGVLAYAGTTTQIPGQLPGLTATQSLQTAGKTLNGNLVANLAEVGPMSMVQLADHKGVSLEALLAKSELIMAGARPDSRLIDVAARLGVSGQKLADYLLYGRL
ncbi:MAG: hypothetical protein OEZ59_06640 [Deltaproteobacteria bacterium]|nr:hypothetical protein [Deltaproteobacteria bacterium]